MIVVGLDALGLALEVEDQAVPQGRRGHGAEVVAGDVVAVVEDRADLGRRGSAPGRRAGWRRSGRSAASSAVASSFSGCVARTSAMP